MNEVGWLAKRLAMLHCDGCMDVPLESCCRSWQLLPGGYPLVGRSFHQRVGGFLPASGN